MTHTEFCYWLQGFLELSKAASLNAEQVACIKEHLDLTFNKVTAPTAPTRPIYKFAPTKYC